MDRKFNQTELTKLMVSALDRAIEAGTADVIFDGTAVYQEEECPVIEKFRELLKRIKAENLDVKLVSRDF